MTNNLANRLCSKLLLSAESVGNRLVEVFHYLALFTIDAMTMRAGTLAAIVMLTKGEASLNDILLLFMYLEFGAMLGIYFKFQKPTLTQSSNILA